MGADDSDAEDDENHVDDNYDHESDDRPMTEKSKEWYYCFG